MISVSICFAALLALSGAAGAADGAAVEETPLARWQADPALVLEAEDIVLEDFHWLARPVVVFADSPNDPRFVTQMEYLLARPADLVDRDVVLITDTDPAAMSALRTKLRPRGFMLVIIGKDGQVKLRKPLPWDVREIGRSIDKLPLRQDELRSR